MCAVNSLYNSSYKQRLEKARADSPERKADQGTKQKGTDLPLADRIKLWWEKLPPEERQQQYRMEFFVEKFQAPPRLMGPLLFAAGWSRKRVWSPNRPHYRVWCPPEDSNV